MTAKKLLYFFLLLNSFFFIACNDSPSSIGDDLITGDLVDIKKLDSNTDSLTQTSYSFKKVIPLGTSSLVLLGRKDSIEASMLLRFAYTLPDSIEEAIKLNELTVQSSWVEMIGIYNYGQKTDPVNYSVHKINSNWTSTGFTIDSLPFLDIGTENISIDPQVQDSLYSYNLDNQVVLEWMKASFDSTVEDNNGMLLKPLTSSGKIVGFQAFSTLEPGYARLKTVISKPGVYIDTIEASLVTDLSVVKGSIPDFASERIIVQSSVAINAKLWFDVSMIPSNAIINYASITLFNDANKSVLSDDAISAIGLYFVKDTVVKNIIEEDDPLIIEGVETKYTGEITSFVRRWVTDKRNFGMIIRNAFQVRGIDLLAFYPSSHPDPLLKPKLTVIYSVKK